jgi:hypothetical protein
MATIVMESAKVIEAATKMIANIKAERKTRDDKTIEMAMGFRRFSFKRGFYYMNREEAIYFVNHEGWTSSWGWSSYAWGTLDAAKKLLVLAQHGDPVTLNENDMENLML